MKRAKWPAAVAMAIGIWTILTPFVLGYELQSAVTNSLITGGLIVAFAAAIFFAKVHTWADWGLVLLGAWLMASPSMFGYFGENVRALNGLWSGMGTIAAAVAGMLLALPPMQSYDRGLHETFASAEPAEDELRRR